MGVGLATSSAITAKVPLSKAQNTSAIPVQLFNGSQKMLIWPYCVWVGVQAQHPHFTKVVVGELITDMLALVSHKSQIFVSVMKL